MNGPESGFLLLTSQLGNPGRKPLSTAQFRILASRVRMWEPDNLDRDLTAQDLVNMGYGRGLASQILSLLDDTQLLHRYSNRGKKTGCFPLTWVTEGYPTRLKQHLREETPGCLWYKGDISLLSQPMVALVGSRDLREENRKFARQVGYQAARQGYVLVSGNARGADQTAQNACLLAGGKVICVVADSLEDKPCKENVLYLSEDGFDESFSAQRAISRNRVIHALSDRTFVAQSGLCSGGTWDGTSKNLRHGWSSVYCFADGSEASVQLQKMGADGITETQLESFENLPRQDQGFFED